MNPLSTERKIIYSLGVILITIQLAIFFVLRAHNGRIAHDTLSEVLQTGAHVTRSLLETRQKQLDESTRVLAGDFGLRQAIGSGDKPTVASMLENHEKRAQGLFVAVHDLNQQLMAKSSNLPVGQRLDAMTLEAAAKPQLSDTGRVNMTSLDRSGETLYHLSTAEVRAPTRLAWISMGFAIDTAFAEELSKLTGMQFMFLARDQQGAWRLHGSTLPNAITAAAVQQAAPRGRADRTPSEAWRVEEGDDDYLLAALPLPTLGSTEVMVVIGKSLDQAMHPLRQVELALLYLIVGSLFVCAGAVYWVTVRMVKPINDSAHHDTLTGLVNRRFFDATLRHAIEEASRKQRALCVLMMDLNKFKLINDQLGHAAGDEVLQVVGRRLVQAFRGTDTVARLGGDEFAVILPGMDRHAVRGIVEGVIKRVGEPFALGSTTLSVGTSIGIAVIPDDGHDAATVMKRADKAMYKAKGSGSGFSFYEATDTVYEEDAPTVPGALYRRVVA